MQISALLLTIAAAATFPDTGPVTTDLTKCSEILSTTNYVAPEVFSAESCLQKFDCYDVNYGYKSVREGHWNYREIPASVSQAVSDCDHCLAKAWQDCSNTQGFPAEGMNSADRECVEKSYKECKPSNSLTDEASRWEPVTAPVEDEAGHRTGISAGEGSTA
ncbi:hypothetical protein DFP73DRAFT_585241 [Morchella snyderi]|nr:hypothetical protein DFP73DRAFT_585241 [Morchella snyderi]